MRYTITDYPAYSVVGVYEQDRHGWQLVDSMTCLTRREERRAVSILTQRGIRRLIR